MILLLSGGLDSIAAWRLLGLPPAVCFDLHTLPMNKERAAVEWAESHFGATCLKKELPMAVEKTNGWVPFRNSILVLAAAQIDPTVVLAAVAEWAPDKNVRWARRLEKAVNQGGDAATANEKLAVCMPFADRSKGELLYDYSLIFGAQEAELLLQNTWSCYKAEVQMCGICGGCRQRIAAWRQYSFLAGIDPPTITAEKWVIPIKDRYRWIRDNQLLGLKQIAAHNRQDKYL